VIALLVSLLSLVLKRGVYFRCSPLFLLFPGGSLIISLFEAISTPQISIGLEISCWAAYLDTKRPYLREQYGRGTCICTLDREAGPFILRGQKNNPVPGSKNEEGSGKGHIGRLDMWFFIWKYGIAGWFWFNHADFNVWVFSRV
jgi:hypothetical protein